MKIQSIQNVLSVVLWLMVSIASAFNHPEIQWKTVTTQHFQIHFYDKTEPAVYAAWKIAEQAYTAFDSLYHYNDATKIHLALADYDDYSNGFARWTEQAIMVWVPDGYFDLRSNTVWLRNVITHELAHIMSLEKDRGILLLDWLFNVQYNSPNVNILYGEPITFVTFFPAWFAEGIAQSRAAQTGSDCWDSRRDMLLRTAVLSNRALSLDAMAHFTHDIIGNEMVYNQGYAFTLFLEQRLGRTQVSQILNENRDLRVFGQALDRYILKTFNVSLNGLYTQWLDSLKTVYQNSVPKEPTAVSPVWDKGTLNSLPRVSADGKYWGWLTNHRDDFDRRDLVIASFGSNTPLVRIPYAKESWDFSPDGNTVYYIKSRTPNKDGSYLNDIFACDISGNKHRRLTESARVYALSASADGSELFCVRYRDQRFSLERYSLQEKKFNTILPGTAGEPFLSIAAGRQQDGSLIVSKTVDGKSGIFRVRLDSTKLEPLVCTNAQQESPFCAGDGRIYFSADYDGVFNIYSVSSDGSGLQRHTSVAGGAFNPVVVADGSLIFSEYTAQGFRIVTSKTAASAYEIPNTQICLFSPLPQTKNVVRITPKPYEPVLLRPGWQLLTNVICSDMDKALQQRIRTGDIDDSSWDISLLVSTEIGMIRSDALLKKDRRFGMGIYLDFSWDEESNTNGSGNYAANAISPTRSTALYTPEAASASHAFTNARPASLRHEYQKLFGRLSPAMRQDIHTMQQMQGSDEDTNQVEKPPIIPLLVPYFGFENRMYKPTFGLDITAVLLAMITGVFYIDPYIEYQAARDVTLGVTPSLIVAPLYFLSEKIRAAGFMMNLPVWVQWVSPGYYNQDLAYNGADLSMVRAFVGPDIVPVVTIDENSVDTADDDTLAQSVAGISFGIDAMHGFAIAKYSSFRLITSNYWTSLNEEIPGTVGSIDSTTYDFLFVSKNRTAFTFPLVRNINRGRLYADNLYGTVFYEFDFYGTNRYFDDPVKEAVLDKKFESGDVSVAHMIGVGIQMGLIKNYTFGRSLMLEAAWDLFGEEAKVTLSWWF